MLTYVREWTDNCCVLKNKQANNILKLSWVGAQARHGELLVSENMLVSNNIEWKNSVLSELNAGAELVIPTATFYIWWCRRTRYCYNRPGISGASLDDSERPNHELPLENQGSAVTPHPEKEEENYTSS